MTINAWNTDQLDANGEMLIGNGSNPPSAGTLTGGTNCTIVNGANSAQVTFSGATTGDWVLTHSSSASAAASVEFTGISSTYYMYVLVIDGYAPGTDTERLQWQTSSDDGSTWDTTNNFYFRGWSCDDTGATSTLDADGTGGTNVIGSSGIDPGSAANETCSAICFFYNPTAAAYQRVSSWNTCIDSSGDVGILSVFTGRESATAINAIRCINSSSDIDGEFRMYGVVAS